MPIRRCSSARPGSTRARCAESAAGPRPVPCGTGRVARLGTSCPRVLWLRRRSTWCPSGSRAAAGPERGPFPVIQAVSPSNGSGDTRHGSRQAPSLRPQKMRRRSSGIPAPVRGYAGSGPYFDVVSIFRCRELGADLARSARQVGRHIRPNRQGVQRPVEFRRGVPNGQRQIGRGALPGGFARTELSNRNVTGPPAGVTLS